MSREDVHRQLFIFLKEKKVLDYGRCNLDSRHISQKKKSWWINASCCDAPPHSFLSLCSEFTLPCCVYENGPMTAFGRKHFAVVRRCSATSNVVGPLRNDAGTSSGQVISSFRYHGLHRGQAEGCHRRLKMTNGDVAAAKVEPPTRGSISRWDHHRREIHFRIDGHRFHNSGLVRSVMSDGADEPVACVPASRPWSSHWLPVVTPWTESGSANQRRQALLLRAVP